MNAVASGTAARLAPCLLYSRTTKKGGQPPEVVDFAGALQAHQKAGDMRRKAAGSGGVPGGGARFRSFVHSPGQVRGLNLMAGTCPFEDECDAGGAAERP